MSYYCNFYLIADVIQIALQVDPSPVVLGSTPCASQTNRGSPSLLLEPVPPACPAPRTTLIVYHSCRKIGAIIFITYIQRGSF